MRKLATSAAFLLLASTASGAVRHVPADYPTIQAALNAAVSGDEVLVAAGTYNENLTMSQDGVLLHSEVGAAATIVNGGGLGTVLSILFVGSTTEVVGFTFTNAGPDGFLRPGLLLRSASPKLQNNIVRNNMVAGGMYVDGGAPWIIDNEIRDNAAPHGAGGGIYFDHFAAGTTENNLISGNVSVYMGGGIAVWEGSHPLVQHNRIVSNKADVGGAGVLVIRGSSPTFQDNEISGNESALGIGGGFHITQDSHPLIENNRIIGNSGAVAAGGIYVDGAEYGAHPTIRGNLIQDNTSPHGSGGGIYCDHGSNPLIEENQILRNNCVAYGGGVTIWSTSFPLLQSNTISLNEGGLGGGNVFVRRQSTPTLMRNILSHSLGTGLTLDSSEGPNFVTLSCNDVWGNGGGNYVGTPDATGTNDNFSADPLFCDLPALDIHINMDSPCAAAHSPSGCDLVGALDVHCDGAVPAHPVTWGSLKDRYR